MVKEQTEKSRKANMLHQAHQAEAAAAREQQDSERKLQRNHFRWVVSELKLHGKLTLIM